MPELESLSPAGTADIPAKPSEDKAEDPKAVELSKKEIETYFNSRRQSSKKNRRTHFPEWKRNVELRIGHVATMYTGGVDVQDEIQTEINPDWSLTKTKTANLYSQVPTVRLAHENKQYAAALPPFAKALNYELGPKRANVGVAMEEVLNDVVNAAGVGAIVGGFAARFEDKLVPAVEELKKLDPTQAAQFTQVEVPTDMEITPQQLQTMMAQHQIPMKRVPQMVSDKMFARRISPIDLLWPDEFTGSNFDDGDFIGYSDKCSWPEAKLNFKLKDTDKEKCVSGNNDPAESSLRSNPEKSGLMEKKSVKFDRLFYWRYKVDAEEKSFDCIWEIVFIDGLDEPPVHGPWSGQKFVKETGKYVGNIRFPVRVLTLTYITDNPIPPSDSSAGRPQVNDLRRSRRDMFNNRERSIPIRWFDVNRIDQTIQETLMRGTWQGMIPTNGDGSRSIGEIARASYPAENIAFDTAARADLYESWQLGPNQQGTQGNSDTTAAESNLIQQNFATRIGQERGRVAAFFLGVAECIAGFMVLHSDFPTLTDQERQAMQGAWDQKSIMQNVVLSILPDSQIVLDSNAKIQKLSNFLNLTVKSGYINPKPIIIQMAELSGIDPTEVVVDPQQKEEEPNVSFRFSGKDDLTNAMVLATMIAKGKVPTVEQIKEAQKLLLVAQTIEPEMPGVSNSAPPAGPEGTPGAPPPAAGVPPGLKPAEPTTIAHPDWHTASKVAQRSEDAQA